MSRWQCGRRIRFISGSPSWPCVSSPSCSIHTSSRSRALSVRISCTLTAITENVPCSSEFLRWMSRGNLRSHTNSWIGYGRLSRIMIAGYKRKKLGLPSEKLSGDVPSAGWLAVIFSEVISDRDGLLVSLSHICSSNPSLTIRASTRQVL